jgi:hypothetical protein
MTIAIPGTTIDVRDINDGGTFIYGAEHSAFPPTAVRQAEARLVDNLVPLSNIMVRKHTCPWGVRSTCHHLYELDTGGLTVGRLETLVRVFTEATVVLLTVLCQKRPPSNLAASTLSVALVSQDTMLP